MQNPVKTHIRNTLAEFSRLVPALFICLLLIRGIELVDAGTGAKVLRYALWSDFIFFLKSIPILFVVFFLFNSIRAKYVTFKLIVTGGIWLLIDIVLTVYFITAHVPLGADMFGYSIHGSFQIVRDSLSFDLALFMFFVLPLVIFCVILVKFKRLKLGVTYTLIFLILGLILNVFGLSALPESTRFENEYAYNANSSKGAFFMESLVHYFNGSKAHTAGGVAQPKYLDPGHPFLRMRDSSDELSEFFNIGKVKPDLVFIQVEGLGRAFSGPGAYLGSFTPFLDELAEKSIYFENFLSAQGRTFAALPSILGSLPFAETGFSDLADQMPKFNSLVSIANANGYKCTYYGGFEMDFDNQGLFMKKAGVKNIVGANDFDSRLFMASPIGYSDKDLFDRVLESESKATGAKLTYIQTISMHNPFTVPDQSKYLKLATQRIEELGFDANKKVKRMEYLKIYSSIIYTDEVLRQFFASYSKLPNYSNTLFVITGDHRLPEIPLSTKIDRYHVPLIIFSPLLKKSISIGAISSHLDIAPSLSLFLHNSYRMVTPDKVTWVGTGLDLHTGFRNLHSYPLKQGKTVLHNYIKGNYFLDNDKLFLISDGMNLMAVDDDEWFHVLTDALDQYKVKNESFLKSRQLLGGLTE